MKKKCLFTTVLVLVVLIIGTIPVFAANSFDIQIISMTAEAGETVTVPVKVSANSSIAAFNAKINFDSSKVKLTDIKPDLFKSGLFDKNLEKSLFVFATTSPITESGVIVDLVFNVLPQAKGDIEISIEITEILDKDINDLSGNVKTQTGKISITKLTESSSSSTQTTTSSNSSNTSQSTTSTESNIVTSNHTVNSTMVNDGKAPNTSGSSLATKLLLVLSFISIALIIGVFFIRNYSKNKTK